MGTHYRPTERQGKQVVYRSLDPHEPRGFTLRGIAVILVFVSLIALAAYFKL